MELLAAVDDADLYAFSDQDDIWSESKLEIAEQWFQKQNSYDSIPLLYHSAYDLVERGKKVGHFIFLMQDMIFEEVLLKTIFPVSQWLLTEKCVK